MEFKEKFEHFGTSEVGALAEIAIQMKRIADMIELKINDNRYENGK